MNLKEIFKKNSKLYIALIMIIVLGTLGITYALTIGNFNPIAINTTSSIINANITYDDGTSNAKVTNTDKLLPIDDNLVNLEATDSRILKVKFSVSGLSNNPENTIYDIAMHFDEIDCDLRTTDLKWRLYKDSVILSEGNLSPTFDTMENNRLVLTNTQEDLTTSTNNYTFLLWISEACSGSITECDSSMDQSKYLNKNIIGSIKIELSTKSKKQLERTTAEEGSCNYIETEIPVCNNLVYNGQEQTLVNTSSSNVSLVSNTSNGYTISPLATTTYIPKNTSSKIYTVENNTGIDAGKYAVILKLEDGYKWNDGSTDDKCIYCNINKYNLEVTTLDQTIKYGSSISNGNDYISTSSLVSDHTVKSYSLTSDAYDVGTGTISASNIKIIDSSSNDVTKNYNIIYKNTGKVNINCLNISTQPSITDRKYDGTEQIGVSGGNYITISGRTKATQTGTYTVLATPQKNYCWSDGTTETKTLTWKMLSDVVIINLNSQNADKSGTSSIYNKSTNICLDENCNTIIDNTTNPITIPTKTGYTFGGYYTEENGSGTQMITSDGYVTEELLGTEYNEDFTLYAYWIVNTYTITTEYRYYYQNTTWTTFNTTTSDADYGTTFNPTTYTNPTGYTANGKFEYYDEDGNYLGYGIVGTNSFKVIGNMTVYVQYLPNTYTVTYNSGNLLHSLDDIETTTASSNAMTYSVSNGVVTVNALENDGQGKINARVYLEANKTYIFNCTTSGTWGSTAGTDTVEAYMMYNGGYSISPIRMGSNSNYSFTPTTSGEYHLRFDVNQSGKTHTFSNISITTNLATKTVSYGSAYGTAPTVSLTGYTLGNWYSTLGGTTQVTSSTLMTKTSSHTIYSTASINKININFHTMGGTVKSQTTSIYNNINNWGTDTHGYIYLNDEILLLTLNYGSKLTGDALYDPDYDKWLYITKTGYTATEGEEWINISDSSKKYDKTVLYNASDFCDASSSNCSITLGVNWRINNVYVRYNTNGGTIISSSTDEHYYTSDSSGLVYQNGVVVNAIIPYDSSLSSTGLLNYNNASELEITKTTYDAVGGKEWICVEGECQGTTYNHATVYSASSFCDASEGDCTVTLGVNWELNSVTIHYDLNGGSFGSTTSSYTFTSDSDEIIYQNGSILTHKITYGGQLGSSTLRNYNNTASLNIVKTGYSAPDGAEWKCLSGCTTVGTTYDHDAMYYDEDFCDLTKGDCTVVLGVNWKINTVTIQYNVNGGTVKASTNGGTWTTDSSGLVYRNGVLETDVINYGSTLTTTYGLMNYNNSNSMYITRSGYNAVSGAQWKCLSGCTTSGKTFNQTSAYAASEFCDASLKSCTVTLGVNWTAS